MCKNIENDNHNLKSNQFVNLTLKNTTIPHDCEMLEYWTEKTFPDESTALRKTPRNPDGKYWQSFIQDSTPKS